MSGWDDFEESSTRSKQRGAPKVETISKTVDDAQEVGSSCDWGFDRQEPPDDGVSTEAVSSKFIQLYEKYLGNKEAINAQQTSCHNLYASNPQKALREWFENEEHEFNVKTDQPRDNEYICSLDLPVEDTDFTLTSEVYPKKSQALEEICLAACKLLDECQLLYPWKSSTKEDPDKKRRFDEANKEDDIELDSTKSKRLCDSIRGSSSSTTASTGKITKSTVNTYDSLMARWSELSRSILQSKTELVKLDLSVTNGQPQQSATGGAKKQSNKTPEADNKSEDEADSEVDPLDEYMSSLEKKTKLTMDDKIEKSRIKSQIAAYESEQEEVAKLIELAKPKFDLNKACPRR